MIQLDKIDYSDEDETVTFQFREPLQLGDVKLYCHFSGIIGESLRGFYRSKTTRSDGSISYCALCQFAPTDARRAFPCFDEPALKASFDVTLVVAKDPKIKALSNMAVKSEAVEGDFRVVKFNKTPVMSSYLVCYVVGEFDRIEMTSTGGVKVGAYTQPGKGEQGQFALEVAAKSLDFYADYFGIPYPLDKLDIIAYPDLSYGAMENYGLVSFREARLLVDPKNTSTATKQDVALVVAHELGHQW